MTLYQQRAQDRRPLFEDPAEASGWPEVRTGPDSDRRATGYRLVWEYPETGRVVVGHYVYASLELARAIARAMDALWPEVRHRAIAACDPADSHASPVTAEAMVETTANPG